MAQETMRAAVWSDLIKPAKQQSELNPRHYNWRFSTSGLETPVAEAVHGKLL
jgi:hypothetical protein